VGDEEELLESLMVGGVFLWGLGHVVCEAVENLA